MKFNKDLIGNQIPKWTYTRDGVLYKFNDMGHRCKNIEEIDLNNYILFAGCSHTEGEGLPIEQTYPHITAEKLQCDYYNLGLSASGFDVLFYNVMTWIKLYKKPKFLVMQYPDPSRFSSLMLDSTLITPHGSWESQDKEKLGREIYLSGTEIGLFHFRNFCFNSILAKNLDIPIVKLTFGNSPIYDLDCIKINRLDYAVDNMHYGPETHLMCAEIILEKFNNA